MVAQGLQILVVDDNLMSRKMFCMFLDKMGCLIDEANEGTECLEMVAQKKYDVIFMDYLMPVMDGAETLKHMKKMEHSLNKNTPVIAFTGNDSTGGESYYLGLGFSGYLVKPVPLKKLEELFENLEEYY